MKKMLSSGLPVKTSKKTESAEKIASKAKMIYSEFIEADAPKEVRKILQDSDYSPATKSAPNYKT